MSATHLQMATRGHRAAAAGVLLLLAAVSIGCKANDKAKASKAKATSLAVATAVAPRAEYEIRFQLEVGDVYRVLSSHGKLQQNLRIVVEGKAPAERRYRLTEALVSAEKNGKSLDLSKVPGWRDPCHYTLSDLGEVTGVEAVENWKNAPVCAADTPRLVRIVRFVPDGVVAKGDRWTSESEVTLLLGELGTLKGPLPLTSELLEATPDSGRTRATIGVEGVAALSSAPDAAEPITAKMEVKATVACFVDNCLEGQVDLEQTISARMGDHTTKPKTDRIRARFVKVER